MLLYIYMFKMVKSAAILVLLIYIPRMKEDEVIWYRVVPHPGTERTERCTQNRGHVIERLQHSEDILSI